MIDISIIIPTYNEEQYIGKCLESILSQNFAGKSYEIIVSDGLSQDKTVEIVKSFMANHDSIILCTNEKRFQVYALNQMIFMAKGEVIIRCDAHAEYENGYFAFLADYLNNNRDIGNLGSHVVTVAAENSLVARVISLALHSKFGVGISHRTMFSDKPKDVDTVLFGAWRKTMFEEAGLFDTNFIRGQDVEHNLRLKSIGKRIVQVPGPKVIYYARNSLSKMFNMMKQYASVKPLLFRKHRVFPNVRSFFPLLLFATLGLAFVFNITTFYILLLFYFAMATGFAWFETKIKNKMGFREWILLSGCYLIQHFGHAYGMVIGMVHAIISNKITWGGTR